MIQAKGIKTRGLKEHVASGDEDEIAYCESAAHWNLRQKARNPVGELERRNKAKIKGNVNKAKNAVLLVGVINVDRYQYIRRNHSGSARGLYECCCDAGDL